MRARLIPLVDISPQDVDRWQRLADRAVEPNMYLDPRFVVPARTFGDIATDLMVLAAEEADEWYGVVVVGRRRVWPALPVMAAVTESRFLSAHADRHYPLLDGTRTAEALATLLGGTPPLGLAELTGFPQEGPLAVALEQACSGGRVAARVRGVQRVAYVRSLAGDGLRPVEHGDVPAVVDPPFLSHDTRRKMRRAARGLEQATQGALIIRDASQDRGAVERFLDLQASGWKGDADLGGGALRLNPPHEAWFHEVVAGFVARRELIALELWAGSVLAYATLVGVSGGAAFGFLDAYNGALAEHGAGTLGRLATGVTLGARPGLAFFDPAVAPEPSVNVRLYPDRRNLADVLVGARNAMVRGAVRVLPTVHRARGVLASLHRR